MPVRSWQPVASLVFCASSAPSHGTPFECACDSSDDLDISDSLSSFCSPSVADVLPVDAVPGRSHDHLFSWPGSDRYNGSSSPSDRLVVHSVRTPGWHI